MANIRFVSLWLCAVMIIVFVLQLTFPVVSEVGVLNQKVFSGEWWRFFSSLFLHANLRHLLANLFSLGLFGLLLEGHASSKKMIIVFFVSGICANFISVLFYPSSLGASGAIMGVIGALTVLRPLLSVWAFSIPVPLIVASAAWIMGDIIGLYVPSSVGNIAHLSGIIVGVLAGFSLHKQFVKPKNKKETVLVPEEVIHAWEKKYIKNHKAKEHSSVSFDDEE